MREKIEELVNEEENYEAIVLGDFNCKEDANSLAILSFGVDLNAKKLYEEEDSEDDDDDTEFELTNSIISSDKFSYPEKSCTVDFIFHTPNIEVRKSGILTLKQSCHLPVFADLVILS